MTDTKLSQTQSKGKFLGGTKGLEGLIFRCERGMDTNCMTSKEKLLESVGTKFTASEKLTLEEGRLYPVGVKEPQHTSKEDCKRVLIIKQQNNKHTEAEKCF